jgi:tetratricopeptide (TPR) repeat protein
MHRYISARALADDLGRFIERRPVRARPLHAWQRFGHWMQREPRLAFAVGAMAVALIAGIAATSLQWQRAERSAAAAREVSRFISEDLLAAADPYRSDENVAAMLAKAEARLDDGLAEQPETRAQIGLSIGRAYIGQGHWHQARLRMERTYADARRSLGPLHPLTLDAAEYLAQSLTYDAQYAEAEGVYDRMLPVLKHRFGPLNPTTMRVRRSHAMMLYETDRFEPAVKELSALRVDAATHAPAMLPEIDATLGDLYTETNRWDEAMTVLQGALAHSRTRLGADHPEYLWQEMSLGDMQMMGGHWDEADATFNNIHEGLAETLGDSHPRTLTAIHYLGLIRLQRGQPAKALPLLRYALRERLRVQGPDHNWTHYSMNRVAEALVELGRTDEAIPLLQQALQSIDRTGRRRQAYVILILDTFGRAYLKRDDPARAEPYLLEGWRLARDTLPHNNVRRGIIERSMGQLRVRQGRYEEARGHYAIAEAIFTQGWGQSHPWVKAVRAQLAALPASAGPHAERKAQAPPVRE